MLPFYIALPVSLNVILFCSSLLVGMATIIPAQTNCPQWEVRAIDNPSARLRPIARPQLRKGRLKECHWVSLREKWAWSLSGCPLVADTCAPSTPPLSVSLSCFRLPGQQLPATLSSSSALVCFRLFPSGTQRVLIYLQDIAKTCAHPSFPCSFVNVDGANCSSQKNSRMWNTL